METQRTFTDAAGTNRIGLIVEVPEMKAFEDVMASDVAADAMKVDGVRPETLLTLQEL
ncbi:MAG: hypothetical protein WD646_00310 [Actinomycetota bacterium]